jgi:hypothetical protein
MQRTPADGRPRTLIVSLPDIPERVHIGQLPPNVDVRLVPPEPEPDPELAAVLAAIAERAGPG